MRQLNDVICLRITKESKKKLEALHKAKPEMTISEVARECLVRGIARFESENGKNDGTK